MVSVNPYSNPDHDEWVRKGHCPVISRTKAWCNYQAGHNGDHASPRLIGGAWGVEKMERWIGEWTP